MTITVVIPHYNDHARLVLALESVWAQTRPPEQVIVVDDGSTEPLSFAHPAELLFTPSPRSGPAIARNIGIGAAKGDTIAFLDSDDLWLPRKLELQERAMSGPWAAWSYTDCYYLGSKGLFAHPNSWFHGWPENFPSGRDIVIAHRLGHNFITMSSVMVRQEACPRFDPDLPVSEDWDWFTRLAARWDGVAVNIPLHLYRLNPAGGRHYRALNQYVSVNIDILQRRLNGMAPTVEAIDRIVERAAIQYLNAGRQSAAWDLLGLVRPTARTLALRGLALLPPVAYRLALRLWCGSSL